MQVAGEGIFGNDEQLLANQNGCWSEAGSAARDEELTYRSVGGGEKAIFWFIIVGGSQRPLKAGVAVIKQALKLTVCLNQSLAAYPGSIGA